MSILIKGMEMPSCCEKCPVNTKDAFGGIGCRVTGYIPLRKADQDFPNWCPLVPVPPHGRLIDADEMADVFRGFIAMYDSCPFSQLATTDKARRDELQAALAEVINAPTVIPAEEK